MKDLYFLLLEIFSSKRNAKYLNILLKYNLDLDELNSIIHLYQDAGMTTILSDNLELAEALRKGINYSSTERKSTLINSIYYLLQLFDNYRTEELVGKYIEVSKGVASCFIHSYMAVAQFGFMIGELKKLYFKLALDNTRFVPFNTFRKECGFVLDESHIKEYLDYYFSENSVKMYDFQNLQNLLKTCYVARHDIKVINEYLYFRTLELDKMKVQTQKETSVKENNKTVKEDNNFDDLLLLGVANGTINLLTDQLNKSSSESNIFQFGGGNFGGGGASSNY